MSIIPYETLIPEEEKDIMKIESIPQLIKYDIMNEKEIPKIPSIFIAVPTKDNDRFTKAVIFVVKKLVPEFKDANPNDISFRHFTEGISNKLVNVTNVINGFSVNVRLYGSYTEYIVDRKLEQVIMNASSSVKVYGCFINGIVYSFIKGRTLCLGDLIDLKTFSETAIAIARHHKINPPVTKTPLLFITLRKWIANLPLEYVDPKKKPYDLKVLKKELIFLEDKLKNNTDIVLCHNDLLLKNLIKNDEGVQLIDFEYSGYNYRAFDLANHFNEWCGFDLNWDNYPNEETQRRFLKTYCSSFYGKKEEEVEEEVNTLIKDIKWFELASHYFWGVWALIQAALSVIDFDYSDYGFKRIERYLERKQLLLNDADSDVN